MKKYFGSSLLEMLLVIAVAGVLIVIAVRYFAIVDLNARVAQAISKIDTITRASYQWRAAERQVDFDQISVQALLEDELIVKTDLVNPWGGDTLVAVGSNGAADRVNITLTALPRYACESLRRHLSAVVFAQVSVADCAEGNYHGDF